MAAIDDVLTCTINRKRADHPYQSSDTGGGTKRVVGSQDVTVTMEILSQGDALPFVKEGDTGTLTITEIAGGTIHTGDLQCMNVNESVEVNSEGAPVSYSIEFGANGLWADATNAGTANAGPFSSTNATFDWA